jgi:hypothetical protein
MDYQQRSHAGVTTIAIFQLVFGALGLACDLLGLVGQAASLGGPGAGQTAQIEKDMEAALPYYKPVGFAFLGVDLLLSVLMLVSGLGLLQRQPWGRPVTIGYAVLSIINRLIATAYNAFLVMPVMKDALAKHGGANAQAAGILSAATGVGLFIGFLFILYPIIVLIVMARPDVKALFGAGGPAADVPPDYDDRRERGPFGDVPPDDRYRQPPDDRLTPE